jgi:hypothetical protein
MAATSVLILICPCGRTIQIPDTQRAVKCSCGRMLVVEAIRNDDLKIQQ